jgi:hypothetical protein
MVGLALATLHRLRSLPAANQLRQRFYEAYPGLMAWLILTAPVWLSFIHPSVGLTVVACGFVIFVTKVFYYGVSALINRPWILRTSRQDWLTRLEAHREWRRLRVIFLVRAYRESNYGMLRASLQSIYDSNWPKDPTGRLINVEVVYCTEENDPITPPLVRRLQAEFAGRLPVREIPHPDEPDVLPGPSSAMHWVGRVLYREALARGEDPWQVLIVDLDSDTRFHPNFLPALVTTFLEDPDRRFHLYQPVVLFTLEYWQAPLHSRLAALATSAHTVGWIRRPEVAFTGAAGTLGLYATVDFWPTNSHSQDSGVEFRLRARYGARFRVVGIPVPVWVYPVMAIGDRSTLWARVRTYIRSFQTLFKQSARWREGPLDEFVEAARIGHIPLLLAKLWSGLERDLLTLIPGIGFSAAKLVDALLYPHYSVETMNWLVGLALTAVTLLGLGVYWSLLAVPEWVGPGKPGWRGLRDMVLFWLVFPFYIPILTGIAGLRTSTAYLLGHRPRGHYVPTPK